jgi:multicomponent Na+:H+ antiporter subunit E
MLKSGGRMEKMLKVLSSTVLLTLAYFVWTRTTEPDNLAVFAFLAFIVSLLYRKHLQSPIFSPKKLAYSLVYVFYLVWEIIKANLDVALRVIRPVIPIHPGIVQVRTKLKSPMGRLVLTSSITLTPGTLTVDIDGDTLFIHWIDVKDKEESGATARIVSNFERYLEVIFG